MAQRKTSRGTERWSDRQKDIQGWRDRGREMKKDRKRQRDRNIQKQKDRETHRQRDRETDKERDERPENRGRGSGSMKRRRGRETGK